MAEKQPIPAPSHGATSCKPLAIDANHVAAGQALRRILDSFAGALCTLRNTVAAFKLAGYNDGLEGLYWPDLMDAIERLLPDEGDYDRKLIEAIQGFENAFLEAHALAAVVPPALLAKAIRAANGVSFGAGHVEELRSVGEQLAALASHHPAYMDAYTAYAEALHRCGWNCQPTIKRGRASLEFYSNGAAPYDRPPVAQTAATKKGRGDVKA